MRAVKAAGTVLAGCLALAGCSGGGGSAPDGGAPSASGAPPSPTAASPVPSAPAAAVCATARALVQGNLVTFSADRDGDALQQALDGRAYYTLLGRAIDAAGGSDPASAAISAQAEKIAADYTALVRDLEAPGGLVTVPSASADTAALSSDLSAMVGQQQGFDTVCGIGSIVPAS